MRRLLLLLAAAVAIVPAPAEASVLHCVMTVTALTVDTPAETLYVRSDVDGYHLYQETNFMDGLQKYVMTTTGAGCVEVAADDVLA